MKSLLHKIKASVNTLDMPMYLTGDELVRLIKMRRATKFIKCVNIYALSKDPKNTLEYFDRTDESLFHLRISKNQALKIASHITESYPSIPTGVVAYDNNPLTTEVYIYTDLKTNYIVVF
tara:strand:- start:72 stop:431 length:360 start_codon:yes stop_codon:yes gene_type:complete